MRIFSGTPSVLARTLSFALFLSVFFSVFFSISFPTVAAAQESLREQGEWMAHYYERPEPQKFTGFMKRIADAGGFNRESTRFQVMVFVAELLKQNPDAAASWSGEIAALPREARTTFAWALHNAAVSGEEQAIATLGLNAEEREKIRQAGRYDPLARPPATPADLDMLWAQFVATGNEAAVQKVVDILGQPLPEKNTQGYPEMLQMKGAAKWSLIANVKDHPRVAAIVKARQQAADGMLKEALGEVLARAEEP